MLDELKEQIKAHEGYRDKPYRCTEGKLTIGYGTNIERISKKEAEFLFNYRFNNVRAEINRALPWIEIAPEDIQAALIRMGYNLGVPRLLLFKKMLAAMEQGDYETAADEALDSRWARQVGNRAIDIAEQIRGTR